MKMVVIFQTQLTQLSIKCFILVWSFVYKLVELLAETMTLILIRQVESTAQ